MKKLVSGNFQIVKTQATAITSSQACWDRQSAQGSATRGISTFKVKSAQNHFLNLCPLLVLLLSPQQQQFAMAIPS